MCWGINGVLIGTQSERFEAVTINAIRMSTAGLILLLTWPIFSGPRAIPMYAVAFLMISLILGFGMGDTLYFKAIRYIGVSRAAPITTSYPMVTAILAVPLLGEPINLAVSAGIILTLIGVYVVGRPREEETVYPTSASSYWRGIGAAAATALCWAGAAVALRPALFEIDVTTANAIRMPFAATFLWFLAWRSKAIPPRTEFCGRSFLLLLAIGCLTALGVTLFVLSIAYAGALRATVLNATAPIFAVPLSMYVLRERASWLVGIGSVFAIVGIILITLARA